MLNQLCQLLIYSTFSMKSKGTEKYSTLYRFHLRINNFDVISIISFKFNLRLELT